MAWYGGMYLLAAIHYQGLLIVVGMIVSLVLILRSLYKQVREAAEAGAELSYSEPPAGERRIVLALVLILSVGGACGYLFGGRYPMEWEEEPPVPEDLKKIRGRLLELGFPEYVLNDLSLEDIRACDGAFRVVVDISDQMVSESWKRTMKYNEEEGRLEEEAYRKEKELVALQESESGSPGKGKRGGSSIISSGCPVHPSMERRRSSSGRCTEISGRAGRPAGR